MKKRILSLLMATIVVTAPILTTTVYADQPGDPINSELKQSGVISKTIGFSSRSRALTAANSYMLYVDVLGNLTITRTNGPGQWHTNINTNYVGYNHITSGEAVTCVQILLSSNNYSIGTVDAKFGPNTQQAVVDFQNNNNLSADGTVGPNTWNKLISGAKVN
ncbi:peptidoglycan-binding protein [Clostridium sp. FP2]|uniref:peptidoglycan-binding domain-containing protein n=1 Tax=Clostridium sp. FP2 TaxID=2724481 RepID=UPI0013E95A89|nr:peptidoglycan-binding domain-containing protein [Clostridium sp. FP2]MBZ9626322.1 peptidoglycan-binding protein [Clostridium sp. FP2]